MSDFFEQLRKFSERVFYGYGFEEKVSPWKGTEFKHGKPIGAILHYTSGSSIRRALRWFMEKKHESSVSAHVVIADGWPGDWEELAHDLPLVKELPAAVVQCVPPERPAWHATWVNSLCYGIEMVNAGELRPTNGGWAWWPDDWTRLWKAQGSVPKTPVSMYSRHWEPYTVEQIMAVVWVLREVQKFHGGALHKYLVLGHEHVTEHKRDPGPLLPIHGVRLAMDEPGIHPSAYLWLRKFEANLRDGETWRNGLVMEWCGEATAHPTADVVEAWQMFAQVARSQFLKPRSGFGVFGRLALKLLGYFTSPSQSAELTSDEVRSVEVFQRMMSLKVDGDPGFHTKAALVSRLEERGILPQLAP